MLEPVADLERLAIEAPDAPALVTPRRTYSFRQLRAAVMAVSARLAPAGIGAGDLVGVDLPAAEEWIVDLALFRLAARTLSLRGITQTGPIKLDALITEPGLRAAAATTVVEVDELWIDSAVASELVAPAVIDYDSDASIVRVILTSGTTGTPRAAAYSIGSLRYRRAEQHLHWTDARRELMLMGLSTTGGFHNAVGNLMHGTPFLAVDRIDADALRLAADQRAEVLCGSPVQVGTALRVLVESHLSLPTLREVRLAGASASGTLLQLIADTLAVPVRGVYGSTEAGGITTAFLTIDGDRSHVGALLPDVELEIVDASGIPQAVGTPGVIRYRTPGQVSGYIDNGAVVPFEGGWFEPGDTGALRDGGTLVLAGRTAELLNIGGVKLDPARVDDLALAWPGVRDAAAFALERRPGIPEVGLALVTQEGCDLRALDVHLRQKLPQGHPTAFLRVDEIPRNRMGKARRNELTEQFGAMRRG